MAIEIVDFPSYNMVDLSIVMLVYQRIDFTSFTKKNDDQNKAGPNLREGSRRAAHSMHLLAWQMGKTRSSGTTVGLPDFVSP